MKLIDLEEVAYTTEELTDLIEVLFEGVEDWQMKTTSAFRKGVKKHRGNRKVKDALGKLQQFIVGQEQKPQIGDYPQEYNVHVIRKHKSFPNGVLDAHLVGSQILVLFNVDYAQKILQLYGLGSHTELSI